MPHTFTTNFGLSYFDPATVADNAFMFDAFVFPAVAFPIAGGSGDPLAEEPACLGFEAAIVDRFGIFNFPVTPGTNYVRRGDVDRDGTETGVSRFA